MISSLDVILSELVLHFTNFHLSRETSEAYGIWWLENVDCINWKTLAKLITSEASNGAQVGC